MTVLHNQITLNATPDKVWDVLQKSDFSMIQVEPKLGRFGIHLHIVFFFRNGCPIQLILIVIEM